jgi:two-component sensor histidine kinase
MDERTPRRAPPPPEGELLAPGLVHELRQPLTGLDAGLRLVARELGPAVTELDGWKIAASQLARVQETLETYQQLMTPGRAEHEPFAAAPVVRRAVDALRHRLEAFRDRFAVVVEGEVPQAHGSAQALYHAVTNLVANALDAVEEAGEEGRVEVRVLRAPGEGARAQVRVADAGAGISPAARRRLFAPRFTTKPRGKGSGLGLAISRRMLRAAGGEVRLARDDDPARRPWARTELVIDLAASASVPAPLDPAPASDGSAAGAARASAAALLLSACVALGWAGFHRWMRAGEEAVATPAVAVAARAERVEIIEAEGGIERLRDGSWEPLAKGAVLREEDTIRTAPGARAIITIGDRSRLAVSDATQLTVREITAAVQRLRLSRGRLSVDHQADGARVLVVESERGDAVARAGTARFSVLANGTALAVATETGIVRLQAADRTVDVGAGEQSVSLRGEAPAPATRISVDLLLRVARAARASDGTCAVEGSVDPGAEVRVDGRTVEPGPDGRFAVRVPAHGRATRATVVTRDASGHVAERRVDCVRDVPEHDLSGFAVRWGEHDSKPQRRR